MAGFAPNSDYFLPRSRCEPPGCLCHLIFPWVEEEIERINEEFRTSEGRMGKSTARGFLTYLQNARRIILQDVAAMLVEDEGRWEHPLLQLRVFKLAEFRDFVESMRTTLSDLSLESEARGQIDKALRGMNRRFDSLEAKVVDRDDGLVGRIRETVKETVNNEFSRIDISGQLADNFHLAAAALRGGSESSSRRHEHRVAEAVRGGSSSTDDDVPACFGHKVKQGYSPSDSIFEMHDEFYGLHNFAGVPIAGGLDAMERQYGSKWRKVGKYWSSAEQKHFSRIKSIMLGVAEGVQDGMNEHELLNELNRIYTKRNGGRGTNLAGCVECLQRHGMLQKKPRKKKSVDDNSSN